MDELMVWAGLRAAEARGAAEARDQGGGGGASSAEGGEGDRAPADATPAVVVTAETPGAGQA